MYIYICLSVCLSIYPSIHPSIHPSVPPSIHSSLSLSLSLSLCVCVCVCVCVSLSLSVCLSFQTHTNIHIHNECTLRFLFVRRLRDELGYPAKPLLQGHAWWHILTGIAGYFAVLFAWVPASTVLKDKIIIKLFELFTFLSCENRMSLKKRSSTCVSTDNCLISRTHARAKYIRREADIMVSIRLLCA